MARRLLVLMLCLALLAVGDRGAAALGFKVLIPLVERSGTPERLEEWAQFGHDPQRTGYTAQTVPGSWRLRWQWNGADASGKPQSGHLGVPDLVQPITGGGRVYIVAGNSVVALDQATGAVAWSSGSMGALTATPAYEGGSLYVPSANGTLYKLDAASGAAIGTFQATSGLNLAPALVGSTLYLVAEDGTLYALDARSMSQLWAYSGGAPGSTPPSVSVERNLVVYVTQDLYVHAVDASLGQPRWRVKPTSRSYQCQNAGSSCNVVDSTGAQAENGWPVIAERHGIVFVRYRLDWNTLWTWSPYPTTNSAIRSNLTARPDQQTLFALGLDSGAPAFVPAVGNGGAGDGGYLPMGPLPVVRVVGGQEVAYTIWRNGQTCAGSGCDGREDATMGEMVLDGTTVAGYQAGDVRFVAYQDIQTDEMMALTMSGETLFHNHWLVAEARTVTDRSAGRGGTFANPIQSAAAPYVIWRQASGHGCAFNAATRYCTTLYSYGDTRSYATAGFYEYFDAANEGSSAFVVVSADQVLVKTADGAVMALISGSPLAAATSPGLADERPAAAAAATGGPISYRAAEGQVDRSVVVEGVIASAVDHRPKAVYLGFAEPHDGALLVRIFERDLPKFDYDPLALKGRRVRVAGRVTLYWPLGRDREIVVTDPRQIEPIGQSK
ncbi:MAG TPA: PQQ-binding-like beta-propeller repeat protein [Chloroflexota bacterium]